jgi:hypothetical protein
MSVTRVPAIPAPTDTNLREVTRALKGVVEVREGLIGDPLDKGVTFRDLVDGGLAEAAVVARGGGSGSIGISPAPGLGSGGGTAPEPDLTPPPQPTGLSASAGIAVIILEWSQWSYGNHAYAEIWRSSTNVIGNAVLVGTSDTRFYNDAIGQTGVQYYYWIRFRSQADVTGPYQGTNGVSATTGKIGNVDLGPLIVEAANLANGSVSAGKLATEAVAATNFASGIEPVTVVVGSTVPTTKSTNAIFLTGAGKLYRWNGSAYVATVPAADISGTLTAAQIASVAASQITGQLTDTQLAAIGAAKVTGQITGTQITDGAISTAKLAAGSVTAAVIAADTITAAQIAANAITSSELAAGAVTAGKIAAGSIQAGDIAAGTITGDRLAANTITASQIASNSITAGQIAAGAISAAQIAAGAITTDKLLVTGRGNALNDDPNTQDVSAWTGAGLSIITDSTSPAGNTVLRCASLGATVLSRRIALDPTRNHQLRIWTRQETGSSTTYLTVAFSDANDSNISGGAAGWSQGTYHYFGLVNGALPGSWTEYRVSFGPNESFTIPAGARYIRVGVLSNYNGSGTQLITGVRLMLKADADLIVDGAISANKIAAGAIAVGTAAIQNGAIVNAMIGNAAIDSAKIADAAITNAKIGDAQITNAKIASLDASKITTGTLDANRIAANSITASQINGANLKITAGAGVQLGQDVVSAGHYGLSLSSSDFNNIFIKRNDGVVFFRVNEGGTNSLSFDSSSGQLLIRGQINGGAFTGWAWPAANNYGFHLGPNGLLLGNYNNGRYFQVTYDGQVYAPGFSIINGSATFSGTLSASIVNTDQIVGGAASPTVISTGDPKYGGATFYGPVLTSLTDNGATTNSIIISPGTGTHTITVSRSYYTGTMRLGVLVLKR